MKTTTVYFDKTFHAYFWINQAGELMTAKSTNVLKEGMINASTVQKVDNNSPEYQAIFKKLQEGK